MKRIGGRNGGRGSSGEGLKKSSNEDGLSNAQ